MLGFSSEAEYLQPLREFTVKTGDGTTPWMTVEASLLAVGFGHEKFLIRFEKLELDAQPNA